MAGRLCRVCAVVVVAVVVVVEFAECCLLLLFESKSDSSFLRESVPEVRLHVDPIGSRCKCMVWYVTLAQTFASVPAPFLVQFDPIQSNPIRHRLDYRMVATRSIFPSPQHGFKMASGANILFFEYLIFFPFC